MSLVITRHERTAGGCANGIAGIAIGETHAFPGHPVDIGGLDGLATVAPQIVVAHVVHHDEDDIG